MFSQLSRSAVTATEEARAFYQARLAVFGSCLFALAGGSWAILSTVYVAGIASGQASSHAPFSSSGRLHFLNGLLAGILWLATRRGSRSSATLHTLDMGA